MYSQIYAAFKNFAKMDFNGSSQAPQHVEDFLKKQLDYMNYMVEAKGKEDIFWEYVGYHLAQVKYMHAGYAARVKR